MVSRTYFVSSAGGAWEFSLHKERFGPFRTRAEAMGKAVAAASEAGRLSRHSRVMAVDESGRIYTAWTYSKA